MVKMGDTGNAYMSSICVVTALYRSRF